MSEPGAPPRERTLQVRRTARYFELGDESAELAELWYVLHGYGQLAAEFIALFAAFVQPGRRIVAPEGLSRYYRDQRAGLVGASWLTKEFREQEIDDYVAYLDLVHRRVRAGLAGAPPITLLGFSQATATAARWVGLGALRPARLYLWGGTLPPTLDLAACRDALVAAKVCYVAGIRDPWMTAEIAAAEKARLEAEGIPFRLERFEGAHRLDDATLARLVAEKPRVEAG